MRLLIGLSPTAETPARTPWWLLLLRMLAAGLVIVALAGPVLDAGGTLPGTGTLLLVVDDGWAAAVDWPRRMTAAGAALDRADREGRTVGLLTTPHRDRRRPGRHPRHAGAGGAHPAGRAAPQAVAG